MTRAPSVDRPVNAAPPEDEAVFTPADATETTPVPDTEPSTPTEPSAARPRLFAQAVEPDTAPPSTTPADKSVKPTPKPRSEDDILLDGSSVVGHPKSRAAAHWAGVLVWIIALPLAWFLLHDGAAAAVAGATPLRFGTSARGLIELGVGVVVLAVALWTARRSSLGAFVVGAVSTALGLPFLVAAKSMSNSFGPFLDRLTAHSDLGSSLSSYFWADAVSGKFVAFGVFMLMVGVISHSARRAGRREQEIIDRVRRTD
ncbi:hypothetical protein [Actinomyces sp. MRS3W]|uniref:hypothetical protein n=1 Tax=Actinomyces sp. MRS3W TaxID=2800796 RepID=UPI0028FD30D1|nr:hypothetical protein [Actinomyces sp. MRS3W]MDU0348096.1 hypothetical protein [Actinomyces sp. MRS3W]